MSRRGFIVGAPRSGSGKTSVAIGLMRAFRRRGVAVAGAKSGPDYIDPGFHAAATGRPGVNLDSWAMAPALLDAVYAAATEAADLVVVESAMGLFDGIPGEAGRSGAAADLARRYDLPVVLVLDVSGQSQTAAAVAKGFATFDPAVRIAGVILNRVGSERHRKLATDAIQSIGMPVIGAIMRDPSMALPERHLGLVQAEEHAELEAFIEKLADVMERSVDLDAVAALAAPFEPLGGDRSRALPPPAQRIAIARDAAFTFVYPHVLDHWRRNGAEIALFSPLADEAPPPACDLCWLPGGYPELHAGRLAGARHFRDGLQNFAATKTVHGECGGYMVLGESLEDASGVTHPMLGLLTHSTSFAKRKMNLGYRRAQLLAYGPLGPAGTTVRGHEFHYASVVNAGSDEPFAEIFDGQNQPMGRSGARRGRVSGTFFHAIAGD
jgi:cobyrinic acid a,c-diamide synthase